jgi:CheY-like chemotaxis protein
MKQKPSTQFLEHTRDAVSASNGSASIHVRRRVRANEDKHAGAGGFVATPVTKDEIIGTILAIGEIPANLDFDCATLRSSGFKVILAGSVNRAFALTEETRPDVVLCDLHLRPLDGFDFLEIAKRTPALRHVPIVIISSTCMLERERRSCLEHGAARFIRRPIPPEALLAEIAEALNATRRGAGHENPDC